MYTVETAKYRCVKINEDGSTLPISHHHYKSTAMFDYKILKDMDGHYDVEVKNGNGEWVLFENEV